MSIEIIALVIPVVVALFGAAKWVAGAAANLTKAITTLNLVVSSLSESFSSFKLEAKDEHEKTHDRLDDHENRIHSLEDWKKFKEEKEK